MAVSDKELLKFDATRIRNYDRAKAQRDLKKHGDAFRHQLVVARHLEEWADRDEVAAKSPTSDKTWLAGHANALRDVAARLRKGDYLPGGMLYDETVAQ